MGYEHNQMVQGPVSVTQPFPCHSRFSQPEQTPGSWAWASHFTVVLTEMEGCPDAPCFPRPLPRGGVPKSTPSPSNHLYVNLCLRLCSQGAQPTTATLWALSKRSPGTPDRTSSDAPTEACCSWSPHLRQETQWAPAGTPTYMSGECRRLNGLWVKPSIKRR